MIFTHPSVFILNGFAKGARTGQTSAVPTCCTDRQGTLQAVGQTSLGPLHLARDSWNSTSVQFNSSSTGGPIESLSYADDQATETKRGEAAREASEAGEEAEEPKPEGGQCGSPENRTLLVPFQLVSPILGGLPRSNLPVVESPFDCHAELERGLPAGGNQGM